MIQSRSRDVVSRRFFQRLGLVSVSDVVVSWTSPVQSEARFPFRRNRLRCVRCVNENRKKRKRLRWQAANRGCHCFDRAFLLAVACVCCVKISRKKRKRQPIGSKRLRFLRFSFTQRKRLCLNGNRAWLAITYSTAFAVRQWMRSQSVLNTQQLYGPMQRHYPKSCFHHIRYFKQIKRVVWWRSQLPQLLYHPALIIGCTLKYITRLQRLQNILARVVIHQRPSAVQFSSNAPLKAAQLAPHEWQMRFILCLGQMHRTLIWSILWHYSPTLDVFFFSVKLLFVSRNTAIMSLSSHGRTSAPTTRTRYWTRQPFAIVIHCQLCSHNLKTQ